MRFRGFPELVFEVGVTYIFPFGMSFVENEDADKGCSVRSLDGYVEVVADIPMTFGSDSGKKFSARHGVNGHLRFTQRNEESKQGSIFIISVEYRFPLPDQVY